MGQIVDLDELLGDDKQVRLAGKLYALPPDLPVELYLRIVRYGQQHPDATEAEVTEALYEALLDLFRYKQPNLKSLPVSMKHLAIAVGRIYGDQEPDEGTSVPPPRKRSGGATKTSRPRSPRTASRS